MGIIIPSTGAYDRPTESPHNRQTDFIVRDTNANGLPLGQHYFWHQTGTFHNKGIWAGKKPLHGLIRIVGDYGVAAYLLQAVADKGERFLKWAVLQSVNELYAPFVIKITSDSIKSVRRISNQTSPFQGLCHAVNQTLLWIIRINRQYQGLFIYPRSPVFGHLKTLESVHMDSGSFMVLSSVLFGLVLGSFINVCIYRIPLKKSIISPASSCPYCGEQIRFYDNIPLVSYLLLLGRCRHCKHCIAWHYPAVEALTALLSLALFIRYALSYQYFLFLLFTATLVTISFIDLHHKIIPDLFSLPGIIIGFASSFILTHIFWLDSLIGIIAGAGSLFFIGFIYKRIAGRPGIGGGDVKLLAMIGAWMGWRHLPVIVFIASLTGAVVGSTVLWLTGKGYRVKIPFGPFLSLGALVCFFFGPELTGWYYSLLYK